MHVIVLVYLLLAWGIRSYVMNLCCNAMLWLENLLPFCVQISCDLLSRFQHRDWNLNPFSDHHQASYMLLSAKLPIPVLYKAVVNWSSQFACVSILMRTFRNQICQCCCVWTRWVMILKYSLLVRVMEGEPPVVSFEVGRTFGGKDHSIKMQTRKLCMAWLELQNMHLSLDTVCVVSSSRNAMAVKLDSTNANLHARDVLFRSAQGPWTQVSAFASANLLDSVNNICGWISQSTHFLCWDVQLLHFLTQHYRPFGGADKTCYVCVLGAVERLHWRGLA